MNQHPPQKQSSSTLLVLCVLTLIGSFFIILKSLISYSILLDSNDTRSDFGIVLINVVYILEFLSCLGSIAGAIIMLTGKKKRFVHLSDLVRFVHFGNYGIHGVLFLLAYWNTCRIVAVYLYNSFNNILCFVPQPREEFEVRKTKFLQ
jgi:hypothetical protein